MQNIRLGYAFCGSFCTLKRSLAALKELKAEYETVIPIMSQIVYSTDTRFFKSDDFKSQVEEICGQKIIHTIDGAEPIGPKNLLDIIIVRHFDVVYPKSPQTYPFRCNPLQPRACRREW